MVTAVKIKKIKACGEEEGLPAPTAGNTQTTINWRRRATELESQLEEALDIIYTIAGHFKFKEQNIFNKRMVTYNEIISESIPEGMEKSAATFIRRRLISLSQRELGHRKQVEKYKKLALQAKEELEAVKRGKTRVVVRKVVVPRVINVNEASFQHMWRLPKGCGLSIGEQAMLSFLLFAEGRGLTRDELLDLYIKERTDPASPYYIVNRTRTKPYHKNIVHVYMSNVRSFLKKHDVTLITEKDKYTHLNYRYSILETDKAKLLTMGGLAPTFIPVKEDLLRTQLRLINNNVKLTPSNTNKPVEKNESAA